MAACAQQIPRHSAAMNLGVTRESYRSMARSGFPGYGLEARRPMGGSLLGQSHDRLWNEFVQHGRLEHFNPLKVFLAGQPGASYALWLVK